MSIGEKIKKVRLENGLYQKDLAKMLGIARETLTGYEVGRCEPDLQIIRKICVFLNISADELLEIDTKKQKAEIMNLKIE
ncbi:MAG: helix-turn-helix transcriptional regulator [Clostridia bacterium]|nr:helix-turn-helix transcriptional regulator [Clostridia bacterium]